MMFDKMSFSLFARDMCWSHLPIDDHSWLLDVAIVVADARLTGKIRLSSWRAD